MKRKNATRNALITSILALLMCVSMLVGTTLAWFTDTVESGINTIRSGNLDVALEYKANWEDEWKSVDENTKIFRDGALYEPGYTEVVFLRVSNAGSLALKYDLSVNVAGETGSTNVAGAEFKLSDHLQVGTYRQDEIVDGNNYADILMPIMFGSREAALGSVTLSKLSEFDGSLANSSPLLPGEETAQVVALVLTMPETVGNEANHKTGVAAPSIQLGINLLATQYTYEEDSFDDQYDADASYPVLPGKFDITNNDELVQAFAAGGVGTVMNSFDGAFALLNEDTEMVLDLNGETVSGGTVATGDVDGGDAAFESSGNLTIKNGTIQSDYITVDNKKGTMKLEDLTLKTTDVLYGFYQRSGETVMDNVTIHAIRGGMNIQGGKLVINEGCHIEADGYSNKVGYGIFAQTADSTNPIEITINGGTFVYNQKYTKYSVIYAGQNASVVINSGTFGKGGSGHKSGGWIRTANGGTVTIYGGTFEFDPSAFVAEGYQAVKGEDGWWTVSAVNAG